MIQNNTQRNVGSWSLDATNYSSGRFFGNLLMLAAAGYRGYFSGALYERGYYGDYWSSSEVSIYDGDYWNSSGDGIYDAWCLDFRGNAVTYYFGLMNGFSVRCVAE